MKTREYFAPLLKWWWLLVLAMITAGSSAYVATRPLPMVYMARTTLVVGNFLSSLNPSQDEIYLATQLAQTYADVARREPVRLATMAALGLDDLPEYESNPLTSGGFLEITVTYSDPKVAQVVANELAKQLILLSPSSLQGSDTSSLDFIEQQLKDVELRIRKTQEEISQKQSELAGMTSAVQINQTQAELNALDARMTLLQQTYANMQSRLPESGRNTLRVYESADLPRRPVGPNKPLIILLSALAGIVLAVGAAYTIEALDNTIKSVDEISRVLELPVIGRISDIPSGKKHWMYVLEHPQSAPAEDFLLLRTNLEFFGVDKPLKTFMISSADIGDGKSTIAANLALTMAQGEKRVILVDADFRRPKIAEAFSLEEDMLGLSDVISRNIPLEQALVQQKDTPQLRILPAGTPPPNPTELLSSNRMEIVINELKEQADIIVFDGPPFIVADSSVLAGRVDGVVLVLRINHSHRAAVTDMREQMSRINVHVLGMVVNQAPARSTYYAARGTHPQGKKKSHLAEAAPQPDEPVGATAEDANPSAGLADSADPAASDPITGDAPA